MKCAFIGTPDFSVPSLERIINSDHSVEFVFTSPDKPKNRGKKILPPPVKKFALSRNVKVYQDVKLFKKYGELFENIDIGIVVASFFFIPKWLLNIPKYGFINLHPSLLPKYRGASPIAFSLLNGDKKTGVSIIRLTNKMDAGPILLQKEIEILPEDTKGTLEERLSVYGANMLVECMHLLEKGLIKPVLQDEKIATYTRKLEKNDAKLDFNKDSITLENEVRAFHPWPGSFLSVDGKKFKIKKAFSIKGESDLPNGRIFKRDGVIAVNCEKGALAILRIQPESKKECNIDDLCRGYDFIGKDAE